MSITIDQQIKCLKKESERRKKVLPLLVEQGRMSEEAATHEIEVMNKAVQTLTQLKGMLSA